MAGHCAHVHVIPVPACYVRPNLPVCVLLALHSWPHRSCFSTVLPAYLSSTACRFCACYDCSTGNPAITQPRHHAPLDSPRQCLPLPGHNHARCQEALVGH
eukprot:scaffold11899_cov133-Isochrysis_galbana.AAC.3